MGIIHLDTIAEEVSETFDIPIEKMKGKYRDHNIWFARMAVYWIADHLGHNRSSIGRYLNRHHSCIIHGVARCERVMKEDIRYKNTISSILSSLEDEPVSESETVNEICRQLGVLSHDALVLRAKIRKVFDERISPSIRGTVESVSQKTGESKISRLQRVGEAD